MKQLNPGRAHYIREIEQQLGRLVSWVEIATRCGHSDLPVIAEDIICGLLNLLYGWKLINANTPNHPNFPGIDLKDEDMCIAVQVTAKNDLTKVKDMLDKFYKNHLDEKFRTLLLVEITNQEPTQGMKDKKDGCFYGKRDIWNIPRIMRDIQNRDVEQLEKIAKYLDKEVGTLYSTAPEKSENASPAQKKPRYIAILIGIGILSFVLVCVCWIYGQSLHRTALRNTLMKNGFVDSEMELSDFAFNTPAKRSEVGTITFLDSTDLVPDYAVDASQLQNGAVLAWAVKNGNLYDLFIAADGKVYAPDDASSLFREMVNLTKIYFNDAFSTKNAENMNSMFNNCQSLRELDVSFFNTENVTDMAGMFCNCSGLRTLDVSGFDTSRTEKMYSIFYGCSGLTELKLGKFDTSSVTNMQGMFYDCSNLKKLDVRNFNTSRVTSMRSMFSGCENLTVLDVSGFDTVNVTDMYSMFNNLCKVTELDISNFNTANVMNMSNMFRNCQQVHKLDVHNFNTEKVTDMSRMFSGCSNLVNLDLSSFDTLEVKSMSGMFSDCTKLAELDLSSFNTWYVTDMSDMFRACETLTKLDVTQLETASVTDMNHMFSGCSNLSELSVKGPDYDVDVAIIRSDGRMDWFESGFVTPNVTDMRCMFNECEQLQFLDLSDFDTSNVTDMSNMFCQCLRLEYVDLSSFDTGNVTDMSNMFAWCYSMRALDLSNFDTSNVTDMRNMFQLCWNLNELNLWNIYPASVENVSGMFYKCRNLPNLNFDGWDLASVEYHDNFMNEGATVNGRPWEELFS